MSFLSGNLRKTQKARFISERILGVMRNRKDSKVLKKIFEKKNRDVSGRRAHCAAFVSGWDLPVPLHVETQLSAEPAAGHANPFVFCFSFRVVVFFCVTTQCS